MVSLAGLSAVYPGMQAAQKQSTQNDMQDLQLQDQQYANAGKQALGKVFQQMVPGAQAGGPPPPQQQMAPQARPPGQPSQPMQPQQPPPGGPPGPAAGGARGPQPGMPVGAPPGGAQPQGGPPGGGGPQGMEGRFDLKTAAAAIAKANPGIQPRVLVEALTAALPYLNAEAKQQVAEMRVQMQQQLNDIRRDSIDSRERMLQTRELGLDRRLDTTEAGRNQRADTAAETRRYSADKSLEGKKYTADTIAQSRMLSDQTRLEVANLSAATRKEIAARAEVGKQDRLEYSAETRRELLTMSLQARREVTELTEAGRDRRLDTQEAGRDRRQEVGEAGKADRQGVAEEGRNTRLVTQEAGRDRRTDVVESGRDRRFDVGEEGRNTRSSAGIASREKITDEKLDFGDRWKGVQREQHEQDRTSREDIAKANRESREGIAQKRLDLSTAREARLAQSGAERMKQQQATLEQRKKEAEARIAKGDRTGQLAELLAVAKLQHTLDMEIISSYSFNSKLKPAERDKLVKEATQHRDDEIAQIKNMAKLGGGGGMEASSGQPPPEALQQLKEGQVTTFQNGQKWTLKGGKPERVP